MLAPGFYALEKSQWQRRIGPRPKAMMSVVALLRSLRHGESLPKEILVPGLERMLYQVYRLHGEGDAGRQAVRPAVNALSRALNNPQARNRLLREGPVIIFVLEYVEHGEYWRAGVRDRRTDQPLELLRLEWLFPRCEVTEVGGESVCYGRF